VSKVNALRRKAADAVRSQKWDEAIKLYERICGADTNNASYRNELGDIYLKKGEVPSAIQAFESAAELYVAFGLTNNAIAVHKKILRHDPGNLDSLWGLGEIRRNQGLEADASSHFQNFLKHADLVSEESRERFLNRCNQLMETEAGDMQVLSGLESIFREWDMAEESARVLLIKAGLAKESDELDMVDKYVEHARQLLPEVESLPEYRRLFGGDPAEAASEAEASATEEKEFDLSGDIEAEDGDDGSPSPTSGADPSLIDLDLGFDLNGGESDGPELVIELDEDAPSPQDLSWDEEESPAAEDASEPSPPARESVEATPEAEPEAEGAPEPASNGDGVDLLAEILADGGVDLTDADERQVTSIASNVAGQIASQVAPDDYKGQYEVGLVYLDMGLYDQAATAFAQAALGDDQRLKALEMQGSCLTRLGRHDEAMRALQEGLATPGYPSRFYLGLLYEAGLCQEALGDHEQARDYFLRVASVDGEFLDVVERLAQLDVSQH
jgi:tetratricopeptide (TPR) repeat protein